MKINIIITIITIIMVVSLMTHQSIPTGNFPGRPGSADGVGSGISNAVGVLLGIFLFEGCGGVRKKRFQGNMC